VFGIAVLAMYVINPYHVADADPRPRVLGFTAYRVPSMSMEPTLPDGSVFLVNLMTLRNRDPVVGEIIVFRYPPRPEIKYVKRVIATGGMTVAMRHGAVYLDGERLAEPYLPAQPITEMDYHGERRPLRAEDIYFDMAPVRVPEHHFFLLGDNRGNSEDSRYYGFVPRELVVGTAGSSFIRGGAR